MVNAAEFGGVGSGSCGGSEGGADAIDSSATYRIDDDTVCTLATVSFLSCRCSPRSTFSSWLSHELTVLARLRLARGGIGNE
jgi:hypothetical protein